MKNLQAPESAPDAPEVEASPTPTPPKVAFAPDPPPEKSHPEEESTTPPPANPRSSLSRNRQSSRVLRALPKPKNMNRWPRCHACCCGVFIPLNIIVTVSLIGGLLLGKLEMQEEINSNDAFMRGQMAQEKFATDLDTVFVEQLPNLCLGLYRQNRSQTVEGLNGIFEAIMTDNEDQSLLQSYLERATMDVNDDAEQVELSLNQNQTSQLLEMQHMSRFFATCGRAGGAFRDDWLDFFRNTEGTDGADEKAAAFGTSLSFNNIRCVNISSPLAFNLKIFPSEQDMHHALPSTQAALYAESWKQSQQEALAKQQQTDEPLSELQALTQSYADATGKEKCAVNMPASGKSLKMNGLRIGFCDIKLYLFVILNMMNLTVHLLS